MRANLFHREVNQCVQFKLSELESVWYCNRKNVKNKLRKLEKEGKYIYYPGRGRGNFSRISFLGSFQQEIEEAVMTCIENDQLEEVVQILQLPIPKSWVAKLSIEVQKLFGFHSIDQAKDVLRTMVPRKITTLDPLYSSINFENYLIQQLGDTLVTYDQQTDSIRPHLAIQWKIENHFTTWTFYLRKGVHFHHQRILTSEDVKYTFERFQKVSSQLHWIVANICNIECLSPYVVRFQLERSNPFFLRYVSSCNLSILPKDEPFDEKNKFIGTGPFQLKKCTESLVALEAFDHYFLERPFLDEIEYYLVSNETNETITYQLKDDAGSELSIEKEDMIMGFQFLAFNFNRSPMVKNHRFRTALYHLIDINKINKDLEREHLDEASSFFPWKSKPQPKNRILIKSLLEESGYQGETLTLYAEDSPHKKEEAEWIVNESAVFGIHIQPVYFNMHDFYSNEIDQNADLLLMGEVASFDLHFSFLEAFYNKALIFRRFLHEDHFKYIENYLESFKYESDRQKREYWIEEVEQYIREEKLILFLYHPKKQRTFNALIQDIRFGPFGYDDFRKSWID
jgi:MarR-like DNA-binding transcriptional regulator SgrR of sgrS sRNA